MTPTLLVDDSGKVGFECAERRQLAKNGEVIGERGNTLRANPQRPAPTRREAACSQQMVAQHRLRVGEFFQSVGPWEIQRLATIRVAGRTSQSSLVTQ